MVQTRMCIHALALSQRSTPRAVKWFTVDPDREQLNDANTAEQPAIVEEQQWHAPAFATMIGLMYDHLARVRPALRGVCCTPADTTPGYV